MELSIIDCVIEFYMRGIILIGERLTELRIKHNMTQEEFAEYMCVTRQSVSKWETDKAYPDVEKMIKIAELYDVSLDYLIRGQEPVVEKVETIDKQYDDNSIDAESSTDVGNTTLEVSNNILSSSKGKGLGLKICLGISTIFCVIALVFIFVFLVQNPWFHSDITEQQVKVEAVYSQLSMAQVSYDNENGDVITELVLLDTANVGQGDYINIYTNEAGNIFIDYGAGVLAAVVIFLVMNLCVVILLVKELGRL
ncbi:MAG: helix-turn-helix transcriptional regulator [Lachnospiraceae bacterium]|nr:helix-turn-helix transcriptional regulator [Lachnospiraceae bacterium]